MKLFRSKNKFQKFHTSKAKIEIAGAGYTINLKFLKILRAVGVLKAESYAEEIKIYNVKHENERLRMENNMLLRRIASDSLIDLNKERKKYNGR
jgi:regulator of replication initiation timing